ncbi:Carbamoyl-phosphate synthase large chain [Sodalis praecaptivus]
MGGTGGGIAYNREEFEEICERGLDLSPTTELLIDESLIGWKEYEMEVVRDKKITASSSVLSRTSIRWVSTPVTR